MEITFRIKEEAYKASQLELDPTLPNWVKFVDGVNRRRAGGYMFIGSFLRNGTTTAQVDYPRLMLVCCPTGTRDDFYKVVQGVILYPDGTMAKVDGLYARQTPDDTKWANQIVDRVEEVLVKIVADYVTSAIRATMEPTRVTVKRPALGSFTDQELIDALNERGYQVKKGDGNEN